MHINDFSCKFEQLVRYVFEKTGYIISESTPIEPYDFCGSYESKKYFVEIKSFSKAGHFTIGKYEQSIKNLIDRSLKENAVPVLVVSNVVSDFEIKHICAKSDIVIIGIQHLLWIIKGKEIENELISIFPFSLDNVKPVKFDRIPLGNWLCHSSVEDSLIKELDLCALGSSGFSSFEKICCEVLKYVFSDDLSLWNQQQPSNAGLYRFDLLCRIKDGNGKTFWNIIENYFHSKYIIFEFKNYNQPISQKEIYTTEKYLYAKALRNVSIIIARNGFDDNSYWAAKVCLRESGKLIMLISMEDLKHLLIIKKDNDDPAQYLLEKLDLILSELEK